MLCINFPVNGTNSTLPVKMVCISLWAGSCNAEKAVLSFLTLENALKQLEVI